MNSSPGKLRPSKEVAKKDGDADNFQDMLLASIMREQDKDIEIENLNN